MTQIAPDDDTTWRFVVFHHRYDPQRRERRNVLVAAYDDEQESWRKIEEISAQIRVRRAGGDREAEREHASGTAWPPGHDARRRNGHLVRRALEHGVLPQALRDVALPPNMAVVTSESPDAAGDAAPDPGPEKAS